MKGVLVRTTISIKRHFSDAYLLWSNIPHMMVVNSSVLTSKGQTEIPRSGPLHGKPDGS